VRPSNEGPLGAGLRLNGSLLVADTAGAASAGVHDDEDDRDGDRYENCPENEPARPAPASAPMLLFPICAHTSYNEARALTISSIPVLLGSSYTRGGRSTRARRTERATPPVEFLSPMGLGRDRDPEGVLDLREAQPNQPMQPASEAAEAIRQLHQERSEGQGQRHPLLPLR
jgi:hypothetical protein